MAEPTNLDFQSSNYEGEQSPTQKETLSSQEMSSGASPIVAPASMDVPTGGMTPTSIPTVDVDYGKIMDELLGVQKNYYESIPNKIETFVNENNFGVWNLVSKNRKYIEGQVTLKGNEIVNIPIYGKPENVQKNIDNLFQFLIDDINNDSNFIISELIKLNFINKSTKFHLVAMDLNYENGLDNLVRYYDRIGFWIDSYNNSTDENPLSMMTTITHFMNANESV